MRRLIMWSDFFFWFQAQDPETQFWTIVELAAVFAAMFIIGIVADHIKREKKKKRKWSADQFDIVVLKKIEQTDFENGTNKQYYENIIKCYEDQEGALFYNTNRESLTCFRIMRRRAIKAQCTNF